MNAELLHVDMYVEWVIWKLLSISVATVLWYPYGYIAAAVISFRLSGVGEGSGLEGCSSLIPAILQNRDCKNALPADFLKPQWGRNSNN